MSDHAHSGIEAAANADNEASRRDFIHIAAVAMTAGGVAASVWPFVRQLGPAADTRALSSADVNLSGIPAGGEIRVLIGGQPFFIRHRTQAEIAAAKAVDITQLRDPQSDDDRLIPGPDGQLRPQYLIISGSCTHLGCVPVGPAQGSTGDYGGWFCPCHGSHYDTSGRIRRGPAPTNLPVPKYVYVTNDLVRISL